VLYAAVFFKQLGGVFQNNAAAAFGGVGNFKLILCMAGRIAYV
jgi:hypothetical protein